jgi:hypothetical protein
LYIAFGDPRGYVRPDDVVAGEAGNKQGDAPTSFNWQDKAISLTRGFGWVRHPRPNRSRGKDASGDESLPAGGI